MVLTPLHRSIFAVLKRIEQDGTFDQDKPLRVLLARIGNSCKTFSFDLSAATDRLPIALQVQVLRHLTNAEFAEA